MKVCFPLCCSDGKQICDRGVGIYYAVLRDVVHNAPIHTLTTTQHIAGYNSPTGVRVIGRHDQGIPSARNCEIHVHRTIWVRGSDAAPVHGVCTGSTGIEASADDSPV